MAQCNSRFQTSYVPNNTSNCKNNLTKKKIATMEEQICIIVEIERKTVWKNRLTKSANDSMNHPKPVKKWVHGKIS